MPKTISFHNGSTWSRGHNIRDERYTSKQEHIDPALSDRNVTLRDIPVRQAYDEIFGAAVQEYNAKQKRADRRIDCYYDKIKADKRKNPVYEVIVQIGDRTDTGNNAELEREALQRFALDFERRNTHLRLIGAYIHCDEPDGTVHLHLDYIPVAECSRGMSIQNSLDRALQQQGFKSENIHQTAQIAWQDSEREALCRICRDLDIDVQRNQGIGQGREYLSPQEYKREKRKQEEQISEELQPLKDELEGYKSLQTSVKAFVPDKKKIPLTKRVSVPADEFDRLEEQAKAYRANRFEVDNVRKLRKECDRDFGRVKAMAADVSKRESKVTAAEKEVADMYQRQKDINAVLERTERDLKDVIAENGLLRERVNEQSDLTEFFRDKFLGAYESMLSIVRAVSVLKYSDGEYRADLTEKQERLIDAIVNYAAGWADTDGMPEIADKMRTTMGFSEGIQDKIAELTPKRNINRGRGGMSL